MAFSHRTQGLSADERSALVERNSGKGFSSPPGLKPLEAANLPGFPPGYAFGGEGKPSTDEQFNLRNAIRELLQQDTEISEDMLWKRLKRDCKLQIPAIGKDKMISELTEVRLEMLSEETVHDDESTASESQELTDPEQVLLCVQMRLLVASIFLQTVL